MTCQKAIDLLAESVDGSLGSPVGWRLKLHLWCCRHCQNYYSTYRQTVKLEKAAFREARQPEPAVPERLVKSILEAARKT